MTGAILAGGASRRLGAPKHALVLADGRTMIEWVAAALGRVCPRLIVAGAIDEVPFEADLLADRRPGAGPLAGIEAVLAGGRDRNYIFCPCDMPLVNDDLLRRLTRRTARPLTVLQVEGEETPRPLPARIGEEALDQVEALLDAGRRAVHGLLRAIPLEVVPVAAAETRSLTNVNTRAEYEALLASS